MQTGRVAAARLDADMEAMPEAVPETSRPLETTAQCYASLAQIRDRLADQASQVRCRRHVPRNAGYQRLPKTYGPTTVCTDILNACVV